MTETSARHPIHATGREAVWAVGRFAATARWMRPAGSSATTATPSAATAVARLASTKPVAAFAATEIPARPAIPATGSGSVSERAQSVGTEPWISSAASSATTGTPRVATAVVRPANSRLAVAPATTAMPARRWIGAMRWAPASAADPCAGTGCSIPRAASNATTATRPRVTAAAARVSSRRAGAPATMRIPAPQRIPVTGSARAWGPDRFAAMDWWMPPAASSATITIR